MNIDLHIEQLILHHCPPGDRERVGAAVRRELERLIADGGLSRSLLKGADIARIDGGGFEATSGTSAETLGGQVAKEVYESIQHA